MVRGFAGPTIASALDQDRDRAAVIDSYFQRLEERFAANPQRHEFFVACVLLAKTKWSLPLFPWGRSKLGAPISTAA